jgi:hypothetical protein
MPRAPAARPAPSPRARRLALTILLAAAVIDAVMLLAFGIGLLVAPGKSVVRVLGTIYVFGWIYLVYLALAGARRGMWDWRFPALVAITGGAIGALVGSLRMRRADAAEAAKGARPARGERKAAAPRGRVGGAKAQRAGGKRTAGPRAPAGRRRSRRR